MIQPMAKTADGKDIKDDELQSLYRHAIDHLRYQHKDVWRGQQFYTTLNLGIIGAAITLFRVVNDSHVPSAILLSIGALFSFFGYKSVKRLRKFFLEAVAYKAMIEYLLGYRSNITDEKVKDKQLAVPWFFPDNLDDQLSKTNEWVKNNIWHTGGITYYFMILQIIFFFINVIVVGFLIYLYLLNTCNGEAPILNCLC